MQSSLWKLGALLGVIGVGFLVLLKAQNDMTRQTGQQEEFTEQSAIDELAVLTDDPPDDPPGDGRSTLAATYDDEPAADTKQPANSPESAPVSRPTPAHIAVSTTPQSSAEPTAVASTEADSSAVLPSDREDNPFASFGFDTAPTPATDEVATSDAETTNLTRTEASHKAQPTNSESQPTGNAIASINPFAELVQSFADKAEEAVERIESRATATVDEAQANASRQTDAVADQLKDQLVDTADQFDPFASVEQGQSELSPPESSKPEATPEPTLALAPEQSTEPTPDLSESPRSEPTDVEQPTETQPTDVEPRDPFGPAESPESVEHSDPFGSAEQVEPPAKASPATKHYEPTSLTALPPTGAGPALMLPSESEESSPPAQQAEPASFETADTQDDTTIAQASGNEPNPFLVFPGDEEPAPARTPAADKQPAPMPQFPSIEPNQSTGRAWISDQNPQIDAGDRVVHPDGTVEMTIQPRGQAEPAGAFNPFAAGPERAAPQRSVQRDQPPQPSPFEAHPDEAVPAAQQRFGDPGLSFSKGPIQPSGAEISADAPSHALTPADFVGVGTISPDTPSTPQQAQLTIEKQAPPDAAIGQELIYSIHVRNVGRSTARNVVVEDQVPRGSELKGTNPQAEMTPDKKLVWQLGPMAAGQQRTIQIKVVPTEAGQIGSVATVSFEAAVASRTIITAPQLRLEMTGPQEVRVGDKAPYKFTLTNEGTADASNVFIRTIIPPGFEHPAAERQPSGEIDIEYEVGTLQRGQSRDIELTLLAIEPGQFQNHAILTADGNVSVEAREPVNVITSRLTIRRQGPANRVVGSEARFTNTLTNESSQVLSGVTVTETVPPGVRFVQASDGGRYNEQRRTVSWQFNSLEPGGNRQLQIVLLPEQSGQLESSIMAVAQTGDKAEAKSRLSVAGFSSLTIDVTNPAKAIPVGQEVALRVKVRNGGTAAANRVQAKIQLPPELRFVSAHGPVRYVHEGNVVAFEPIDQIGIQAEQTFDVVLVGASENQDARVIVQLESQELSKPLSEDESVVIYAENR